MRNYFCRIILPLAATILFYAAAYGASPAAESVPGKALAAYLHNGDYVYNWELKETARDTGRTVYHLLLTSQRWKDRAWTHQLSVVVPDRVSHPGVLLLIAGGDVRDGAPVWSAGLREPLLRPLGRMAVDCEAVTALVGQVPNQPLYDSLREDALISYTLQRFMQDGDPSWPLLFPMTKSAVRAMDAVTEFCAERLQHKVGGFVVSGASKRGWTTWLAAAQDERVMAASPWVIDMLNMPKSIPYQKEALGEYSDRIGDYAGAGVLERLSAPEGRSIVEMIDPYSYRRALSMPKLLVMGTNDPYWVVDNVKNYIDSIPGQNALHYVPNAGHSLASGTDAIATLEAFFSELLEDEQVPPCRWKARGTKDALLIEIDLARDRLLGAELWSASSATRDFRHAQWTPSPLEMPSGDRMTVGVPWPGDGYGACYVDLIYRTSCGLPYRVSTRVFMSGSGKLL